MAAAIRMVTVQRGIDPRDFTLVAFGGAGPVHVARLAESSPSARCVVPWAAGVASAVGLLGSDPTVEVVQTRPGDLAETATDVLDAAFGTLEARARDELGAPADARGRRDPQRRRPLPGAGPRADGAAPRPARHDGR